MPQVIITFVPTVQPGQLQLVVKKPHDVSVRDLHKALCQILNNLGVQHLTEEEAPLVQIPQPEIQTPW